MIIVVVCPRKVTSHSHRNIRIQHTRLLTCTHTQTQDLYKLLKCTKNTFDCLLSSNFANATEECVWKCSSLGHKQGQFKTQNSFVLNREWRKFHNAACSNSSHVSPDLKRPACTKKPTPRQAHTLSSGHLATDSSVGYIPQFQCSAPPSLLHPSFKF